MKRTFIIIMVILYSSAFADEAFKSRGDVAYLFGEICKIRERPSLDGRIMDQLTIGTAVEIIKATDVESEIDGMKDYWFEIRAKNPKGVTITGAIWGGLLCSHYLEKDIDGDGKKELLLVGNRGNRNVKNKKNVEIRIVKNGRMVSKFGFSLYALNKIGAISPMDFDDYRIGDAKLKAPGLLGLDVCLVVLTYTYDHVAYPGSGEVIVALKGKDLKDAIYTASYSGEALTQLPSVIYPIDEGGKKGTVIVSYACSTWEGPGTEARDRELKETYIWNGTRFVKK